MNHHLRLGRGVGVALAALLALPAVAAAEAPVVSTGGATGVGQTAATLTGTVNPKGNRTFSFFQFGTSRLYGSQTPEVDRGRARRTIKTSAPVTALSPFTTYHYRIVAQHGNKLVFGKDRTFKTDRQPLGLTLGVAPGTVRVHGATTLFGNLSGTGNAGRPVVLQANPFPFSGFFDAGNSQNVDRQGNFSFPVLDLPVTTQYRVALPDKPKILSPVITVSVQVKVRTSARRKVRRGRKVTFKGTVSPANDRAPVSIQRRFHGVWVTVARTRARDGSATSSRYRRRVRVRRSGRYRVLVTPGPAYIADTGPVQRIRVKRRG